VIGTLFSKALVRSPSPSVEGRGGGCAPFDPHPTLTLPSKGREGVCLTGIELIPGLDAQTAE
jgi:hypothetical protein